MNFLSPLSLIWFIPLGAIIVVLYLLKLKRKEHLVSSVMLWQDAVADIQANAPFQKLKKSLLLLLQLLALVGLVAAVARPYVRAKGVSENRIVVVLDSSASMQSTDVSPSRFEDAKRKAIDVVRRMGPGDTMLVITAGAKARVVASFTSDKRALAAAITSLRPVDTGCNMRQALVLALSLVASQSAAPPRIVVLSDGGFGEMPDLSAGKAKLDYLKIGRACDNVAITGLDSRKTLSGDQEVFIGLRNYGKRERVFNLEVYLGTNLLDIREEKLAPGEIKQEIMGDLASADGRVTAKLDISDDLAADNTGTVYLTRRRGISVLMVSKGNIFLQNALALDPRTQLTRTDAVPDLLKRRYDLVVLDGIRPTSALPPGGYLLINTDAPAGPASWGSTVSRPTIVDSAKNHPASAYVDFSGVRISEARYVKPEPWATGIVEGDGGTLAVAGARRGRNYVQLGFSLLESDFPLHVGFPIFIANCLDWLAPKQTRSVGDSIRTGQPAYIDVPPGVREVTVTNPDGRKQRVKVTQIPLVYDDTDRAGLYRVTAKVFEREFAANISSSEESNTIPREALAVGSKRFTSGGSTVRTNRELYGFALLAVLAVLMFEWYAYHRRL